MLNIELLNLTLFNHSETFNLYRFTVFSVESQGRVFRIGGNKGDGAAVTIEMFQASPFMVNLHHGDLPIFYLRHGLRKDDIPVMYVHVNHGVAYYLSAEIHVILAFHVYVRPILIQALYRVSGGYIPKERNFLKDRFECSGGKRRCKCLRCV